MAAWTRQQVDDFVDGARAWAASLDRPTVVAVSDAVLADIHAAGAAAEIERRLGLRLVCR